MNQNSFTYGVEIEGVFTDELLKSLDKKCELNKQDDGSVRTDDIYSKNRALNSLEIENSVEEISLGIFRKQTDLMQVLEMVESKKSHFWDKSCGLHLHIKPKRDETEFLHKVLDMQFLKSIESFAYSNLCYHIKRRKTNTYCLPYTQLRDTISDFQYQEKYRFVRYHPDYNTLEFRFFSPCQHKCENIKTFLDYFRRELKKTTANKKGLFEFTDRLKKTNIKDNIEIKKESNITIIKKNYVINKRELI